MVKDNAKIFLAGDRSSTAKDLKNILFKNGYNNIIGCNTSNLDLRNTSDVDNFFYEQKPDIVFIFAAKIEKNLSELRENPFIFLNDNLLIALNTINACIKYKPQKVIYFSSDRVLPFHTDEYEVDETEILQASFRKTKVAYSLAKLVSTQLCIYANKLNSSKFISLLPCYIYGNSTKGFVFSILKDFINAKARCLPSVVIWGDKNSKYKLIHSRDLANAAFFVMNHDLNYDCYNVVPKNQISKYELVSVIAEQLNYTGEIIFDSEHKFESGVNASSKRLNAEGWSTSISLNDGIKEMIEWYNQNNKIFENS